MFGVILCSGCGNPRVIDLASTLSRCPRCGGSADHRRAKVHLRSDDQAELRAAIWSLNSTPGFIPGQESKETISTDPVSKLQRQAERISDPEERLRMVVDVLSEDGEGFTLSDLEDSFPENAGSMLQGMIELGLVYEPRPGRYQRL